MQGPSPFGKYILLDRISVGGMAEVFRGKTTGVEGFARRVAVKRILPHLAEDQRFVRMFIAEAKMAARLHHANIAQVMELGRVDDEHFIAMEYVSGRDLLSVRHHVRKTGHQVPLDLGAFIGAQVAEGLAYAHDQRDDNGRRLGIVHRDVSPQNILVSFDGAVKLIDFGIAKAATADHIATRAGVLKGKFSYMTPEQIEGRGTVDHRSDIFSLGAVLFELLTGERLFDGDNDFVVLERVREANVPPPSVHRAEIPPALDRIILKALARNPDDRYANSGELAEALSRFVYTLGMGSPGKRLRTWLREEFADHFGAEKAHEASDRRVVMTSDGQILELPEDVDEDEPTELWSPSFDDLDQLDGIAPPPMVSTPPPAARAEPTPPSQRVTVDQRPPPAPASVPTVNAAPPPARLPLVLAIVGLLAAAGAGVLWWLQRGNAPDTVELTLRIEPPDQLTLKLDGQPLAATTSPVVRAGLAPGKHTVEVERPGHVRWRATVPLGARPRELVDVVLRPLAPTMVHFEVQPPGAEITLNGRTLTAAERQGNVQLAAGAPVAVRITAPGYEPVEAQLQPGSKPSQVVKYRLKATPGQLFVECRPPAEVFLNDQRVGRTPLSGHPVDVSQPVKLRLEARGYRVLEEVLHFGERRTMTLSKSLERL